MNDMVGGALKIEIVSFVFRYEVYELDRNDDARYTLIAVDPK